MQDGGMREQLLLQEDAEGALETSHWGAPIQMVSALSTVGKNISVTPQSWRQYLTASADYLIPQHPSMHELPLWQEGSIWGSDSKLKNASQNCKTEESPSPFFSPAFKLISSMIKLIKRNYIASNVRQLSCSTHLCRNISGSTTRGSPTHASLTHAIRHSPR